MQSVSLDGSEEQDLFRPGSFYAPIPSRMPRQASPRARFAQSAFARFCRGGEKALREKLRQRIRSDSFRTLKLLRFPGRIRDLVRRTMRLLSGQSPISLAGLAIIGEKIARGCEFRYRNRRRLVMPPYAVGVAIQQSAEVQEPFSCTAGRVIDFGPGCRVRRVFFPQKILLLSGISFPCGMLCIFTYRGKNAKTHLPKPGYTTATVTAFCLPKASAMPVSASLRTLNSPTVGS